LETRFEERTAELFRLNQLLQWEIAQQAKTQEQNRLMLQTLNSTTEMIWVADLDGRIVLVNPSFLDVYGYIEEEVLGESVDVLWSASSEPGLTNWVLEKARRGGWKGEVWSRRKDGEEFPIYLSTSRILDEEAQVIGMSLMNASDAELARVYARVGHGLESGDLRPVIQEVLPLSEAATAHERVMESGARGNVVLTIS
jgi:PAS domain S-box-containing protein